MPPKAKFCIIAASCLFLIIISKCAAQEYVPGSIIFDKEGTCPEVEEEASCEGEGAPDKCTNDCECKQYQKCCFFSKICGTRCLTPSDVPNYNDTCPPKMPSLQRSKPGKCPPKLGIQCFRCQVSCTSDCECPGSTICCNDACGPTCREPISDDGTTTTKNYNYQ